MAASMALGELWQASNYFLAQIEPAILALAALAVGVIAPWVLSAISCAYSAVEEKGIQRVLLNLFFHACRKIPGVSGYILREQNKVIDKLNSSTKSKRSRWISELPKSGLGNGVLDWLNSERQKDMKWEGKCSGTVYIGGTDAEQHFSLLNEAYALFAHTNPLHADVFPSIAKFEAEVVAMTASMLGSKELDGQVCGNMTSGGTESILMAVKSTRDYMRATKGITKPEMIIPVSAHSAYNKAAQYFQIKLKIAPVTSNLQADVSSIKRLINKNTIMIVGSAPGFPHGVVDPIEELGALAINKRVCFHVDLCLGGFVLPFARKLGYSIPPFDFSVPGVTSISIDVHKYGLAPKGTSVVLYRNHEIRRVCSLSDSKDLVSSHFHFPFPFHWSQHQFVAVTDWSGGLYISPSMAGSRPGALIAGAWAALASLGEEGYLKITKSLMEASKKLRDGIQEIPGLYVLGDPAMTVIAFGSNDCDIFRVNDAMSSKGWSLNALQKPSSVHFCVTLQHVDAIDKLLEDLRCAVKEVKENQSDMEEGMAPIYGAAGKMPDRGIIGDILIAYMDNTC
ncbi:sphingosine-1-phosphate lyase isoform X1 [Selaginella moellendorffii]|uniref:sphingosine-1-phosphate lyase isoform X1 n=1 Tax=Selaginella moellendorffii TaxID=88036 RepID=UPI000D1CFA36|nr:sphingosine-1-phosphate lyase isoform X1 [Selaginella moellendorffii]|eukprot:XP_024531540.1 sphingosine-1-phosphate lyase isoform X1 [Selaginella moellendorffii]